MADGTATENALAQILALRAQGAERIDPIGLHYLEALAHRVATRQGAQRCLLDAKLARALATFQHPLAHTPRTTQDPTARAPDAPPPPPTAAPSPLGALLQHMAQATASPGDATRTDPHASGPELKSVQQARDTWARLSVERQVSQALTQAPHNVGPINSHRVVLQSLALMRDTAPHYLNRFITYADTLLCLSAAEQASLPGARAGAPRNDKKPRGATKRSRHSGNH